MRKDASDTSVVDTQSEYPSISAGFVPTPTSAYKDFKKKSASRTTDAAGDAIPLPIPLPIPIPLPFFAGSRVLQWKQDPSVAEIGIRKAYLPNRPVTGPADSRIASQGLPPVSANALGDFIQTPGTDAFDAVHTFTVVRQTLTMYQRALAVGSSPSPLPWQWNSPTNTEPLKVFAHGLPDTMNAFFSRSQKALKFGDFIRPGSTPPQRIFTCRSFDIVAHECGHAILDGLKPNWIGIGSPPQTGGLHESFGDLTAIFLTLSQMDQVEAIIAQTRANLHDKTFLSDMAEEFGSALGRPNGLRNADNNLKLSETGTEVHAISQVFTGAIYDVLADIFMFERRTAVRDDAKTLYDVGQYVMSLVIRAIMAAPATNATYADVANQMLTICAADGKPVNYRNFIRNHFSVREVVVSPVPLTADAKEGLTLLAGITDDPNAVQSRRGCCGTMNHPEYCNEQKYLDEEIEQFKAAMEPKAEKKRSGR